MTGASRTDSGVHAEHQVATFRTERAVDLRRLPISLNALLPRTIVVYGARVAEDSFHPIRSCLGKAYRYRFWLGKKVSPFAAPYVWQVPENLDVKRMQASLSSLNGKHDFTAFCAADSGAKTRVRHVIETRLVQKGPLVDFWIVGDGFLKQMVRAIAGTLVQIGLDKRAADFAPILLSYKREMAGPTAPACGLSLCRIFYERLYLLDEVVQWNEDGFNIGLPFTSP